MLNNIISALAKEIKAIDSWNNFEGITQPGIAYIPISYIRTMTKELLDILNELTKEKNKSNEMSKEYGEAINDRKQKRREIKKK